MTNAWKHDSLQDKYLMTKKLPRVTSVPFCLIDFTCIRKLIFKDGSKYLNLQGWCATLECYMPLYFSMFATILLHQLIPSNSISAAWNGLLTQTGQLAGPKVASFKCHTGPWQHGEHHQLPARALVPNPSSSQSLRGHPFAQIIELGGILSAP